MGSLADALEQIEGQVTYAHQLAILKQICAGMEALAAEGLLHGHLALRNCLLFDFDGEDASKTVVKVSDFGFTIGTYPGLHLPIPARASPLRYMSPEALQRRRFSEKSDVWGFGVMAFELLSLGDIPYFEIADDDRVIAHVTAGGRLPRPHAAAADVYDSLWSLIRSSCWASGAAERPSFQQLGVLLGQIAQPDGLLSADPPYSPESTKSISSSPASEAFRQSDMSQPDDSDLFVLNRSGKIVTVSWIFENGYSKADCTALSVAAEAARERMRTAVSDARLQLAQLDSAIDTLKGTSSAIEENASNVESRVNTGFDAILERLTVAINGRRHELLQSLSKQRSYRQALLAEQLPSLHSARKSHASACVRGEQALQVKDLETLNVTSEILEMLQAATSAVAGMELTPVTDANMFHTFEPHSQVNVATVEDVCDRWVGTLGQLGMEPPTLHGMSDPAPYCVHGEPVLYEAIFCGFDVKFRMEPDVPDGLQLNPATGTISGRPTARLGQYKCTLIAGNAAGEARCEILFTIGSDREFMYAIGGCSGTISGCLLGSKLQILDSAERFDGYSWKRVASMGNKRFLFACGSTPAGVYAIGGANSWKAGDKTAWKTGDSPVGSGGIVSSSVERYDGQDWYPIPGLNMNRRGAVSVNFTDPKTRACELLTIGGVDETDVTLASVESFNGYSWDAKSGSLKRSLNPWAAEKTRSSMARRRRFAAASFNGMR
jgi:serine/threonine protein kinase